MASRIQGITVEIGGDTTKLSKALEGVNKSIKGTQSGLKDVNKLLKLDPSNTELVVQKQKMLPFRQLKQSVLVPGERFALAVRFGLEVGTRLAQVYEILLHDDLQNKKARAGAQAERLLVAIL